MTKVLLHIPSGESVLLKEALEYKLNMCMKILFNNVWPCFKKPCDQCIWHNYSVENPEYILYEISDITHTD